MSEIRAKLKQRGVNTYLVQDAGHTQIKAGSRTVLGFLLLNGPNHYTQLIRLSLYLS